MKEVVIVRTVDNEELYCGETIGECQRWCDTNCVTGTNGEYIAIGEIDENGNFEMYDYDEIRNNVYNI